MTTTDPRGSPCRGLRCPRCGGAELETTATRPAPHRRVWRRRKCRACGRALTTYEGTPGDLRRAVAARAAGRGAEEG